MLKINEYEIDDNKKVEAHFLPCTIENFDSKAPVSDFFHYNKENSINPNNKDLYKSHFHGRALIGKEIQLPNNLNGFLYKKGNDSGTVDVESCFDKVMLWEHDIAPDSRKLEDMLHWFEMSKTLHTTNNIDNDNNINYEELEEKFKITIGQQQQKKE